MVVERLDNTVRRNDLPPVAPGLQCESRTATRDGLSTCHVSTGLWKGSHAQDTRPRQVQRILGDMLLPDGMNLNPEIVKKGWRWWYRRYAPGDTAREGLE